MKFYPAPDRIVDLTSLLLMTPGLLAAVIGEKASARLLDTSRSVRAVVNRDSPDIPIGGVFNEGRLKLNVLFDRFVTAQTPGWLFNFVLLPIFMTVFVVWTILVMFVIGGGLTMLIVVFNVQWRRIAFVMGLILAILDHVIVF
jgi:hypothetical protein